MIPLLPVVERLRTGGCVNVAGVLEYAGLAAPPTQLPAHFVAPDAESASESRTTSLIDQRVAFDFRVVVVVRADARDPDRPSEELEAAIGRVVDGLIGWQHPDAADPLQYRGGSLMSAGGRLVAWGVRFRTHYHLRRTPDGQVA